MNTPTLIKGIATNATHREMPRISPSLIHQASKSSRLLPLLLRTCRTLPSAHQELQWIKAELPTEQWLTAALRRSKGVPLQYVIGSQPFADLDIECKEGVLIPRWETEEWCVKLVDQLEKVQGDGLRIVDMCTGTGCVALLMAHRLRRSQVRGIDVSETALCLSEANKMKNGVDNVLFEHGNVFDDKVVSRETFDIVTANPPYITQSDYTGHGTERSVKLYEPRLALVGENEFFTALVNNVVLPSQAAGFIFELGYAWQFEHTGSLLSDEWKTKLFYDGAGLPRCVVGWKQGSIMEVLYNI